MTRAESLGFINSRGGDRSSRLHSCRARAPSVALLIGCSLPSLLASCRDLLPFPLKHLSCSFLPEFYSSF